MSAKHEEDPGSSQTPVTTMTSASSLPPPEKPSAIQTRFRVVAAFWAVILFLGFPIWWKTTSIYRAELPLQEMLDWAGGKVRSGLLQTPMSSLQNIHR
jgi:phosphatidylinositol glycan class S